jgi:hypothetical protein
MRTRKLKFENASRATHLGSQNMTPANSGTERAAVFNTANLPNALRMNHTATKAMVCPEKAPA